MDKSTVSKATLGRLPLYLDYLKSLNIENTTHISATTIAKKLSLGDVQVRKDLASVSSAGRPKLGYETQELIDSIEKCLGHKEETRAVLVGAGKLGKALLDYDEFEKFGVKIIAAFDSNEKAIQLGGNIEILPISKFEAFCKKENIQLGIITVGEGSAQAVCDQMVKNGITAIWNFAPCKLKAEKSVLVKNENLALSLAYLNNQLNK